MPNTTNADEEKKCPKCKGLLWLCEEHGTPWEDSSSCCPGPGMPCECNMKAELPDGFKVLAAVKGSNVKEWFQ